MRYIYFLERLLHQSFHRKFYCIIIMAMMSCMYYVCINVYIKTLFFFFLVFGAYHEYSSFVGLLIWYYGCGVLGVCTKFEVFYLSIAGSFSAIFKRKGVPHLDYPTTSHHKQMGQTKNGLLMPNMSRWGSK